MFKWLQRKPKAERNFPCCPHCAGGLWATQCGGWHPLPCPYPVCSGLPSPGFPRST